MLNLLNEAIDSKFVTRILSAINQMQIIVSEMKLYLAQKYHRCFYNVIRTEVHIKLCYVDKSVFLYI